MTAEERKALNMVLDYMWQDESDDFEEATFNNNGVEPENHIFGYMKILADYLEQLEKSKPLYCPDCGRDLSTSADEVPACESCKDY